VFYSLGLNVGEALNYQERMKQSKPYSQLIILILLMTEAASCYASIPKYIDFEEMVEEADFTARDTSLIVVEGDLYEVNTRAYYDLTDSDNLLLEVLGPMGLPSLIPDLKKRLREIFEEKKESF